jgi:glycosyltransferase involved in cell wall biosynthesis
MNNPLVSVIIPVFNSEKFILESLNSVSLQTYDNMEIIVVDDGSTDSSVEKISNYCNSICILKQTNKGPGSARNVGVHFAKGDYIAFLDSDDLWLRDKLRLQMKLLNKDSEVDIVFGGIENFLSPEYSEISGTTNEVRGFHVGTMLISKENFLSVGNFNENLKVGEFIEWYARAIDMNMKIHLLNQTVMKRRRHDRNMSLKFKDDRSQYLQVFKDTILRRSRKSALEDN